MTEYLSLDSLRSSLGSQGAMAAGILAAVAPLAVAGWGGISKEGGIFPLGLGLVTGLLWMALFRFLQRRRSAGRRKKAVAVSSGAEMDRENLDKVMESDKASVPSWVSYQQFQKVNWLNSQIAEVWPNFNKATATLVKDTLTPILENYKIGVVKRICVKLFTLGNIGPQITGIRTYKSGTDEISIEAEISWKSNDQKMILEIQTSVGANLQIRVSDIRFSGAVKIILKPLANQLPGFGAVMVSLREEPKIDFGIGLLGGDITLIPGIERMIDNIIKASLSDTLVWPARIVVPIIPGDYSFLELRPIGYLDIVLLEGTDIPKTDFIGKSDPFVFFYVHQKEGAIKRSSIKMNNLNPVWNECFYVEVEDLNTQDLMIRLMDDERFEKAEYIGSRKYPLNQLTPNVSKELWLDMVADPDRPKSGKRRGKLHLLIKYIPYKSKEEAEKSPARVTRSSGTRKQGDGIPYKRAKEGRRGEEAMADGEHESKVFAVFGWMAKLLPTKECIKREDGGENGGENAGLLAEEIVREVKEEERVEEEREDEERVEGEREDEGVEGGGSGGKVERVEVENASGF